MISKIVNECAPEYLSDLLETYVPTRSLRSVSAPTQAARGVLQLQAVIEHVASQSRCVFLPGLLTWLKGQIADDMKMNAIPVNCS